MNIKTRKKIKIKCECPCETSLEIGDFDHGEIYLDLTLKGNKIEKNRVGIILNREKFKKLIEQIN